MANKSVFPIVEEGEADPEDRPESKERVFEIPLSKIDEKDRELCFRVDLTLSNLKKDIERNGQQFPVLLRKKETGLYQIVSGFRRFTALKELGAIYIRAIVRELTDDEAYYTSFIENEKRKNLNGLDKSYAITKLTDRGKSPKEIQALYGIGERQYYRLKSACEFPKEIRDAIADGFIQVSHGLVLMEAYGNHGLKIELDDWIDWMIDNRPSVRQLRAAIKKKCSIKKSNFIVKNSRNGFVFRTLSFNPLKTDLTDARTMLSEMEEATDILREWCRKKAGDEQE